MTFDPNLVDWAEKNFGRVRPECGCTEARMCFKHKLKTIQFAGRGKTAPTLMEKQWDKDRPAYYRLRMNGLQPPSIKGSAKLENHANSQVEIETGHLFDKKVLPKVEEGMALSKELEWKPQEDTAAVDASKQRRLEGV